MPNQTFSPAEVQNFLIARKKDPKRALLEVEQWRDTQLELKVKGAEVVRPDSTENKDATAGASRTESSKPDLNKVELKAKPNEEMAQDKAEAAKESANDANKSDKTVVAAIQQAVAQMQESITLALQGKATS